ncbi:PREDICTED: uncharacterized protein LOC109335631 [Lupinus angustifolius]|uniref:uncharacterized protein LOC109335631 n=1 Tax=Lupinus angustifolius TaxID=3871 RepID=UPI00092F4125|nr:PREDICTED: uncharacterized protein LOC109335631 [Lupinus angustifolius]
MNSTSLINSSQLFHPFSTSNNHISNGRRSRPFTIVMASNRGAADQNFGGRLVDESMIVLRKRIHEMNMIERNYEPPSEWMDWEKRYYTSYDSMICEAMGFIQTQLMNTRPSLALGVMALVALSVPTSTALVLFHLVDFSKATLAGVHLC